MKYWYHHKTVTPSLTPLQTAAPCLLESQKRYQATSSSCNPSSKLKPEELWQDVGCWVIWVIWSFFDATFLKFFGCLWKKGQVRFFLLSLAQFPSLEDGGWWSDVCRSAEKQNHPDSTKVHLFHRVFSIFGRFSRWAAFLVSFFVFENIQVFPTWGIFFSPLLVTWLFAHGFLLPRGWPQFRACFELRQISGGRGRGLLIKRRSWRRICGRSVWMTWTRGEASSALLRWWDEQLQNFNATN